MNLVNTCILGYTYIREYTNIEYIHKYNSSDIYIQRAFGHTVTYPTGGLQETVDPVAPFKMLMVIYW